ncbi:MAG: hypothetical protein C4308_07630 [Chitinophagaceae bacterium]
MALKLSETEKGYTDKDHMRLAEFGLRVTDHITAMLAYWDKDRVCRFTNNAYREWFGNERKNDW